MLKNFLKNLVKPKSKNEDSRRKEFILNILLISIIIFLFIAIVVSIIEIPSADQISYDNNAFPLMGIIFIFMFFNFLLLLSKKGFFVISSYILLGIFFILSSYIVYEWGVELITGSLFYILTIIMSGILISTKFAFITTALASLSIITINFLHVKGIVEPNLFWKYYSSAGFAEAFFVSLIFGIIVTVSWLSNREIKNSLNRTRELKEELKKERDLLEVKVEQRTKQLKQAQVERMTEMSRLAEFGKLSSGLFHDLMNPLTAVSLNIKKIKETHEIKEIEKDFDRAIKATNQMHNFINSVRKQIAHQETKEVFSLNEEIKESIQVLAYRARQNKVILIFTTNEEIRIFGNPIKFNQLITNLISNAIDAYKKIEDKESIEKEIEIKLGIKENDIIITVKDWASGIGEEIIDKIFDPLFTTKDFKHGTGIGLFICKEFIEKDLQGTIKVESEKDKGTKFIINFPMPKNE
jgi:signal transduction histidine kinase